MPIYMDRHDLKSVTARDVAEAHREDLKIQDKFQCKGLTYWFDEERGTAFCLIEAPNENCVKEMHDHAHGLIPHQIIEVDKNVVNAFLGRIEDPESNTLLENTNIPIIDEPAFRIIAYIQINDFELLKSSSNSDDLSRIVEGVSNEIRNALDTFNGNLVRKTSNSFILSFMSVSSAIDCTLAIQKSANSILKKLNSKNHFLKIGLSAGSPVSGDNELFGRAVLLAKTLSEVANRNHIYISSKLSDIYNDEHMSGLAGNTSVFTISLSDENFLLHTMKLTEFMWSDPEFDVGKFGKSIGLSRSQFYRKISNLTGYAPNDFIKEFRLRKALKLLTRKKGNVTEIAFEIGFTSPSYFTKCFRNRYGISPSAMRK
jgi:AraC-like DNA-binding protein